MSNIENFSRASKNLAKLALRTICYFPPNRTLLYGTIFMEWTSHYVFSLVNEMQLRISVQLEISHSRCLCHSGTFSELTSTDLKYCRKSGILSDSVAFPGFDSLGNNY